MKVLILGDSPFARTGFGRVNHHAAKAFIEAGFEVGAVTALQTERNKPEADLPVSLFIPKDVDEMGVVKATEAIPEFKPDVLYVTGDPGNAGIFTAVAPDDIPLVAYVPIEGEPIIHTGFRQVLSAIDFFTCSKYGVDVVKSSIGKDVDFVYHGVDQETFSPLTPEERTAYRKRLGWDDKFVITCVAQNVRRKQIPRLIEAVAILKKHFHQKDVVLYLHTVPFQNHWLDGWNLHHVSTAYGVYDEIIFNPFLDKRGAYVPERGDLDVPGLRELMGAGDLFVLPSQIEGFGLPIVEAMACGLPTLVTKYGAGWEVAHLGGGVGIEPHDFEIHKSGTRYANIDPMALAKEILRLKRDPKQRSRMTAAGLNAVKQFDWTAFEKMVVERVRSAAETKAKSATSTEPSDQAAPRSRRKTVFQKIRDTIAFRRRRRTVSSRARQISAIRRSALRRRLG